MDDEEPKEWEDEFSFEDNNLTCSLVTTAVAISDTGI